MALGLRSDLECLEEKFSIKTLIPKSVVHSSSVKTYFNNKVKSENMVGSEEVSPMDSKVENSPRDVDVRKKVTRKKKTTVWERVHVSMIKGNYLCNS